MESYLTYILFLDLDLASVAESEKVEIIFSKVRAQNKSKALLM